MPRKKKTYKFVIDMDSTITKCTERWLNIVNKQYNIDIKYEDITHWYRLGEILSEKLNLTYEEGQNLADSYLYKKGFFGEQEPYDGAIEVIKALMDEFGDEIIIGTKPPASSKYAYTEKFYWIQKQFQDHFAKRKIKFAATPDKDVLNGDFIIEDSVKNVERSKGVHKIILFRQPWNKSLKKKDVDYVVKNWREIYKLRKQL